MIEIAEKFLGIGLKKRYELMDYYNVNCYPYIDAKRKYKIQRGDEWCAMFTSVIAHMAGIKPDAFPYEVSVFYQYQWAKERGLWFTKSDMVEPNDLIIYDWKVNGTYDHVGIVKHVKDGLLTVIEGNRNNTVAYRKISVTSKVIKGYIKIYGKSQKVVNDENERIETLVAETLIGKHGTGLDRIKSLGNDHYEVQARINRRLK